MCVRQSVLSHVLKVLNGLGLVPLVVASCNSFVNVLDCGLSSELVSRCFGPFRQFENVCCCLGWFWVNSDLVFLLGS